MFGALHEPQLLYISWGGRNHVISFLCLTGHFYISCVMTKNGCRMATEILKKHRQNNCVNMCCDVSPRHYRRRTYPRAASRRHRPYGSRPLRWHHGWHISRRLHKGVPPEKRPLSRANRGYAGFNIARSGEP